MGAFFSLLAGFWELVGRLLLFLGRFFCVLGRSGSDFGASGLNFGRSNTPFFDAFSRALACNAKESRMRKNCRFSYVFVWFSHIASCGLKPQNDAKSFLASVEQSSLQKLCYRRVLGRILGGVGPLLGVTWPAFVCSWAAPGAAPLDVARRS